MNDDTIDPQLLTAQQQADDRLVHALLLHLHDEEAVGGDALDGYDGQQSWRIRAGALVETKEGPGAGGLPMPQLIADMPQLDLPRTLQSVHDDYTVESFDDTALPGSNESVRHVVARRKSTLVRGPETIEIWADPQTGLPRRIVSDKAKFQGSPEPRQLVFELVSDSPLPAHWFAPASHLKADPQAGQ